MNQEILGLLIVAAIVAFAIRLRSLQQGARGTGRNQTEIRYTLATSLLTKTEHAFYQELQNVVGSHAVIQCKVRLADILIHESGDRAAFARVSQKHVDFLVCDQLTLKPIAAVELDDSTHQQRRRQERDAFVDAAYQSAKLPIIHVAARSHYSQTDLSDLLTAHIEKRP